MVKPDAEPEKGYYFRSDHFNFAKGGSAGARSRSGSGLHRQARRTGDLQMREKYTTEDYHKPSDKIKPYWDLSGAVEDLRLFGEVGYRVANSNVFPMWKAGSEFKARRDTMMK